MESVGLREPVMNQHRGKRRPSYELRATNFTFSSLESTSLDSSCQSHPSHPPASLEFALPIDELPLKWLQDKAGDYLLDEKPAHVVASLEAAALDLEEPHLPF